MKVGLLRRLNLAKQERRAAIVITELVSGEQSLMVEGDDVAAEMEDVLLKAFRTGKSAQVEVDGRAFFLNVHLPAPRLVVIGAVHISQALATIAQISGYAVEIIDPRTAFATPERFENIELFAEWPEDVLPARPLDAYCAMVAVTHDPKIDDYPLIEALKAECFYVGALGSRKTHGSRVERLTQHGIAQAQMERICAPIGLDIGAASPQEIAVAIMAEVIDAFRNRGLADQ